MKTLVRFIFSALAILVASYLLEDFGVHVNNFTTAVVGAIVLSLLNFFIKPIITILTIPLTILTLGLFLFIINALIIYMASGLVGGFEVENIWSALLFSIVYSITMSFFDFLLGYNKND
ncbi:phage holin family protein [Flexithrix dorotheae]|uniref:phage holin family protein n=1 Tax=Flexithrix dorotheae TaxID=70993 RepID=UPI000476D545|nr:phage holin family protein [Flexithrix dorotheae]